MAGHDPGLRARPFPGTLPEVRDADDLGAAMAVSELRGPEEPMKRANDVIGALMSIGKRPTMSADEILNMLDRDPMLKLQLLAIARARDIARV